MKIINSIVYYGLAIKLDFNFFFKTNVKQTQNALKNLFIKAIFLYCLPSLSLGSKEIFIKKERKSLCFMKGGRGGGGGGKGGGEK